MQDLRCLSRLAGEIAGELASGDRTPPWEPVASVVRRWAGEQPGMLAEDIADQLDELGEAEAMALALRSREVSTHYAWLLHREPIHGFSIWINEFKEEPSANTYAASIHDHRYDFTSTVLAGGYVDEHFDVADLERPGPSCRPVADLREFEPGTTHIVRATEFHRVSRVRPGTCTLVVKSPARKAASRSWDVERRRWTEHLPIESRVPLLVQSLMAGVRC